MIDVVQQARRAASRCAALRILSVIEPKNELWPAALKLTAVKPTLHMSRALRLEIVNLPSDNVEQTLMCALSLLHVRASFLWTNVGELITNMVNKGGSEAVWTALLASMRCAAAAADTELLKLQRKADGADEELLDEDDQLAVYWAERSEPGAQSTSAALMHSELWKLLQWCRIWWRDAAGSGLTCSSI